METRAVNFTSAIPLSPSLFFLTKFISTFQHNNNPSNIFNPLLAYILYKIAFLRISLKYSEESEAGAGFSSDN